MDLLPDPDLPDPDFEPETVAAFAHGGPRSSPREAAGQLRARFPGDLADASAPDLAAAAVAAHLWMRALHAASLELPVRFGRAAVRALARCQLRAAGLRTGARDAESVPEVALEVPGPQLIAEVEDAVEWLCEQLPADPVGAVRAVASDLAVADPRLAGVAVAASAAADALEQVRQTAAPRLRGSADA